MAFQKRKQGSEKEDDLENTAAQVLQNIEVAIKHYRHGNTIQTTEETDLPDLLASFSGATYGEIASRVGLDPTEEFHDVGHFELHRARIPNELFAEIGHDIFRFAKQYQFPAFHDTEEATSAFVSPIFNHIVARFDGLITNKPKSVLRGGITGKGRVEYRFSSLGGLTVLFIEVQLVKGSWGERLNAVAQVIAQSLACDEENKEKDLISPVYGILCEGSTFQFFTLDGSTKTPTFLYGRHNGHTAFSLPDMRTPDYTTFLVHLRPICDVVFYIILTGYIAGLTAWYDRSLRKGEEVGQPRCSTTGWLVARDYALWTMSTAKQAAVLSKNGDIEGADMTSTEAFRLLAESVRVTPRWKLVGDAGKYLADPRVMAA